MNGKLFSQAGRNITDPSLVPFCYKSAEVLRLSFEEDRLLLETLARHGRGTLAKAALRRLGIESNDEISPAEEAKDEMYFLLGEQVKRVDSMEVLKDCAMHGSYMHALFAFCRLTGGSFPAPDNDSLSHRTYDCGCAEGQSDRMRILNFLEFRPFISERADLNMFQMRLSQPVQVKEYELLRPLSPSGDPRLSNWVIEKGAELKEKAQFTVRFSGCENRLAACVMAEDAETCASVLHEFEEQLDAFGIRKKENS